MRRIVTIAGLAIVVAATSAGAQATKKPAYKKELPDSLTRIVKVTEPVAAATALSQVPGGRIQSVELEREDGKVIYSFDIKAKGKSGIEEVQIDAMTGAVSSNVHETPADEKKEAAKDASVARMKKAAAGPKTKPPVKRPPV